MKTTTIPNTLPRPKLIAFPECIIVPPHIVADPCRPRWVVQCEHGQWFWYEQKYWTDKRNEIEAFIALTGLCEKISRTHISDAQNS